jgi:hypothetical protein
MLDLLRHEGLIRDEYVDSESALVFGHNWGATVAGVVNSQYSTTDMQNTTLTANKCRRFSVLCTRTVPVLVPVPEKYRHHNHEETILFRTSLA